MKKIIDGKAYNTETGTLLTEVSTFGYPCEIKGGIREVSMGTLFAGMRGSNAVDGVGTSRLYQTVGGAYFMVHEVKDGYAVDNIEPGLFPLTRKEAVAWAEKRFDAEKVESIFGKIPEAGQAAGTILLRVPDVLKKRLAAAAADAQQSVNAWAMRCLEVCCDRKALVRELAIAQADLFTLTFVGDRFTLEGCHEIANHALGAVQGALAALGVDDATDVVHIEAGDDFPNWEGREYDHIRTEGWESRPR